MKGSTSPSAGWQMTQSWVVQQHSWGTPCHPEGPAQVWEVGPWEKLMRFNKAKCKMLCLSHVSLQYPCRPQDEQIRSCPAEDSVGTGGSGFGHELVMCVHSPESQLYPGHSKSVTCGLRKVILLLCTGGTPTPKRQGPMGAGKGLKKDQREQGPYKEQLMDFALFSLEKR